MSTRLRTPHRPAPRPPTTRTVVVGVAKGGTGKTTCALHIAWAAAMRGWRVLLIDTDRQGDAFRRLGGDDETRRPHTWAPGCTVVSSPAKYDVKAPESYDLIIVDTPPAVALPAGRPRANLVLLPIDGVDAAMDARETVAEAAGVPAWIVLNKVGLAGKRHGAVIAQVEGQCPDGVAVSAARVPVGGDIARTDWTRRPAWEDQHVGKAGRALRTWADSVLDWLLQ